MTLRQKILLMFSLTIVLTVASVAWAVAVRVRVLFDAEDGDRTTALVGQFFHEYERRGTELANKVERVAHDERVVRMDSEIAHGGDAATYGSQAAGIAQEYGLDFLELAQADGTVLASRPQGPALFGDQDLSAAITQDAPYLKQEQSGNATGEIGLFVNRTVSGTEEGSGLRVVGGEKLNSGFVSALSAPAGSMIYLYRNLTPGFDADNLSGATGPVANAARYHPLIDRVRSTGTQVTAQILRRNSEEQSVSLTALPLRAADGSVAAVLLVANSRDALIEAQEHIRAVAYGVAAIGILFAVMVSLWIAASVSRPIEQLAEGAREVSAGNLDVTVPVRSSSDEIATLGTAFNGMTLALVQQRKRLVQSERVAAWRELAGGLAHELGRPLRALQLTVEDMLRRGQVSPEVFEEHFGKEVAALAKEISGLTEIVDSLGEFSGVRKPQLARLDVRDVVAGVARRYEPSLAERAEPIRVETRISSSPLMIDGDAELLGQAFSTLMLNAADAMPTGGLLTIAADEANGLVRLIFADTGEGMPEEERTSVFTPYPTRREHGTGAGLAIVHSILADHHGTIAMESEPGRGTSFHIELPNVAGDDEGRT
jgi:two-component system nitrogen regulation sensor histidine kinase NtrY